MANFIGQGVFRCSHPIPILATAAIAGEKEGQGPMSACFDRICSDSYFGQTTWEQAEGALQRETVSLAIEKAGLQPEQLDGILAGDLVNQCTSSSYGLRGLEVPFLGIYGACSTMSEGLLLASLLADGGAGRHFIAATSSHFSTAERQFRFPLSYGAQRTPTTQWTCTASGAAVLAATAERPALLAAVSDEFKTSVSPMPTTWGLQWLQRQRIPTSAGFRQAELPLRIMMRLLPEIWASSAVVYSATY